MSEINAAHVLKVLRAHTNAIGGFRELALRTGLSRETLYRTLGKTGNPTLATLLCLCAGLDLELSVCRIDRE